MNEQNIQTLEQQFPSVELAYPLAVAAYDSATKRLDSIDGRLQTILAFIVTVSVIVPSIAAGRGVSFQSGWFYAALIVFIVAIGIGIWARLTGDVRLLSPSNLFQEWLSDSEWQFKKDMIYHAGQDFDKNMKLALLKWRCSVAVTLLFVLQAVCQTVWVLSAARP
jgi:hypothetical protein